jgi:flavodoxin
MNKALIIHHSKTGTTQKLGTEIAELCKQKGIEAKVVSIDEFIRQDLVKVDYLFLGCWTQGLFLFNQHPDKKWVEFANQLPVINNKQVVLFTTYKIATGSMFRKMKERLKCDSKFIGLELKSRNGKLNEIDLDVLTNSLNKK